MSTAPRPLTRRPSRTVPATLLGVVVLAASVVALWLLIARIANGSWPPQVEGWTRRLAELRLDSSEVAVALAVVAVLGLIMIAAALWPGRRSHRELLRDDTPGVTVIATRDIAGQVRRELERTNGVQRATVTVASRRVEVTVSAVVPDEAMTATVRTVAERVLASLRVNRSMKPRVRVRSAS